MIPRCPVCSSLVGTCRTAAGKRMWCAAPGCSWSAMISEEALTGQDMCAVSQYIINEDRDTHGLPLPPEHS